MFAVENLCKEFETSKGPLKVLDNINLDVVKGEFVSIVGPSGCGKSTLLRIIGGLEEATSGRINFKHEEPNVSFVFQDHGLLSWRTLRKNVDLPRELRNSRKANCSKKMLAKVGLKGFEDYLPAHVSGGMKQKTALARALSFNPNLILMDEPFAAVDELSREALGLEVKDILTNGKTILFTTHSLEEAVFLSDKVAVMSERPACIKEVVEIGLPKNRSLDVKHTQEFQRYLKWIKGLFRE